MKKDQVISVLNEYGKKFDIIGDSTFRVYCDDSNDYDVVRIEEYGISINGRIGNLKEWLNNSI